MAAKEGPVEIVKYLVEKACINIKDDNGVIIYYCSELVLNLTYYNLIPTCAIVHLSCYLKKTLSGFKLKTYKQNHPFIVEKNENNHQKCTFTIVVSYTAKPVNFWIMLSIIGTIFDFVSFHYQRTALHIAAKEGQKVIMEILVDKEADVNMKDNDEVSVYKTE